MFSIEKQTTSCIIYMYVQYIIIITLVNIFFVRPKPNRLLYGLAFLFIDYSSDFNFHQSGNKLYRTI